MARRKAVVEAVEAVEVDNEAVVEAVEEPKAINRYTVVCDLQNALGVGISGEYDRVTHSAMRRAYLMKGITGTLVYILQLLLHIKCNGKFDDETEKAVIAFNEKHGIEPFEIAGADTFKAIFNEI